MPALFPKRPLRAMPAVLALLAAGVLAVVVVKRLDEDNRFCVACHLHEDVLRDMSALPPVALSSAHFGAASHEPMRHPERCFSCHSGEGVVGWTQVTLLSAWDAARWVAGDRAEPTHMRLPLTDAACLKCHAPDVRGTQTAEETDAFHKLSEHSALPVACIACHQVHRRGEARRTWLADATVRSQCARCHRDFGGTGAAAGDGSGAD